MIKLEQSKRNKVSCDEDCGAFEEPKTFEEYKKAHEHWKRHDNGYGCSHGC